MKRWRGLAFITFLLAWFILAGIGNVAALQNRQEQELGNSLLQIITTPTRAAPKRTPTPKTTGQTPSTKSGPGPIEDKGQNSKSNSLGVRSLNQTTGAWQRFVNEDFEGAFPSAGWTVRDLNYDPCHLCWDDASYWDGTAYRAYSGSWAAWPPRGGTSGYPPSTYINYVNNMDTRMIYGPFDLSNAKLADADFRLWRDIEPKYDDQTWYDYLALEVSHDGVNFQMVKRWEGDVRWWEFRDEYYNDYVGDNSVWVAWRFYSDSSNTYQGPWVDDIRIWKYVPGQVTARGTFSYADRDGQAVPARFTKVHLYDQDPGGTDDELAVTTTDANGFFEFPAITNWDEDDAGLDTNSRRLDLYVVWETDYNDSGAARHRVANLSDRAYTWTSFVSTNTNNSDGTVDFSSWLPPQFSNLEAMWIFQDLRRAWQYVWGNTNPQRDPGSITARWQTASNELLPCRGSCFYAGVGGPYIFIAHGNRLSPDTVVHEAGHHYMYNATQWWLWWDIGCYEHNLFTQEDVNCAWSEGWGDFFALAANSTLNPNDTCYDFGVGPCGAGGAAFENLEARNRNDNPPQFPWGDAVEGRVAGALYDLHDNTNDIPFDNATFGFDPITDIVFQAPHEDTFFKFWESWKASGQNKHLAVSAIYQNTIDYDSAPRFSPPLPDLTVLQGFSYNNVIDLWTYSTDDESMDWELGWQIVNAIPVNCGVSLDANGNVDLAPQPGWLGSCDVTVSVSDSLKANTDIFRVTVEPVRARGFLPIILK